MSWFRKKSKNTSKKIKTVMFALAMSAASFAQAHAQAVPQQLMNQYILKVHQLHQADQDSLTANQKLVDLHEEIQAELKKRTCVDLKNRDIDQALVHTALIQRLAETVQDSVTAKLARQTTDFIRACDDAKVLYEQLPAKEAVQAMLDMSKKELEELLNTTYQTEPETFKIKFGNTEITYAYTDKVANVIITTYHNAPIDSIPEDYLMRELQKHFSDSTQQQQALTRILQAIQNH